jgi:AcrR family transcriptional regulator
MADKILDRRVHKTRKLLQDALVDLISEKGFEAVTVQEILDRANVGRSTFYTHFQDKYELMHSCFDELGKMFEHNNLSLFGSGKNPKGSVNSDFTLNIFRFVARNHRLFKALLGKQGIALFNPPLYDGLLFYVYESFKSMKPHNPQAALQTEMAAHYFICAFIGVLRWWVEKDMPCTSEEVDKLLKQFSTTGFKNVLDWN